MRGSRIANRDELTMLEQCCVASSDASYGVSGPRWWAAQSSCVGPHREHFGIAPRGRLVAVTSAQGPGAWLAAKGATQACVVGFAQADCGLLAEVERWRLARRLLVSMRAARSALETRPRDDSLSVALVAAAVGKGHIAIARAGRTFAYRLRGEVLTSLCRPGSSPGGALLEEPVIHVHDALAGDAYLLCTAGVVAAVPEEEMRHRLVRSTLPLGACNELVRIARRRDPTSDATAVVLRLGPTMSAECGEVS